MTGKKKFSRSWIFYIYKHLQKIINIMSHPLSQFTFCPKCGASTFIVNNEKSKRCSSCGFVYYFNPSSAVACFIKNRQGELLCVRRAKEPAKGTLDLPGGFVDMYESAEEAARREVKEETGLELKECRYLFSIPNIYPYCGFDVHTVDMFFECLVDSFDNAQAADDAAAIIPLVANQINPEDFGLQSIQKAVSIYIKD
jgi:ADP-ribose pyrophosphatase YjhB (NUDIX family)